MFLSDESEPPNLPPLPLPPPPPVLSLLRPAEYIKYHAGSSPPLTEKSSEQLLTVIWAGLGWQKSSLPEPGLLLQCQPLSGGQHQLAVPHPLQAHQVTDQAVPLLM